MLYVKCPIKHFYLSKSKLSYFFAKNQKKSKKNLTSYVILDIGYYKALRSRFQGQSQYE